MMGGNYVGFPGRALGGTMGVYDPSYRYSIQYLIYNDLYYSGTHRLHFSNLQWIFNEAAGNIKLALPIEIGTL